MKDSRNKTTERREYKIKYSDDLIWGVHPVFEVIQMNPGRIVELIFQKDRHGANWEEMIELARKQGIKHRFVNRIKISGAQGEQIRHQGVVCRGASITLTPFDEILSVFTRRVAEKKVPKIIVCDSIQDPHNLGAIIRSAHAAGIDQVLTTRDRSAPLGGTAAKASAGAISRVDICQVTNLVAALKDIKKAGGWIFGAVKDESAQSIYDTDFNVPSCLVVGNEGQGIRQLVSRTCDFLVSIPMAGQLDSLNCSVAGAIIMFEMLRQKLQAEA